MPTNPQSFERLVKEVRPWGGVVPLARAMSIGVVTHAPLLLWGGGVEGAIAFGALASRVAYGSAVLLFGLDPKEVTDLDARAEVYDFRAWHGAPGVPEGAHCWIKSHYDGNVYWTHREHLLEAVKRTTGPVLELGSGDGSTLPLHEACAATDRMLVTVESNDEWLTRYRHLETTTHILELLADPAETPWLDKEWGVIFVDHAPGETRRRAIERARGHATYIVTHDTEELSYNVESVLAAFTHRKDFRYTRPWTTVVSDHKEIW